MVNVFYNCLHNGKNSMKSFAGDTCGRNFKTKSNLYAQKRIHSGERQYKCEVCAKSFTQKGHLTQHLLVQRLPMLRSNVTSNVTQWKIFCSKRWS